MHLAGEKVNTKRWWVETRGLGQYGILMVWIFLLVYVMQRASSSLYEFEERGDDVQVWSRREARIDRILERGNVSVESAFDELLSEYVKWHSEMRSRPFFGGAPILVWTCYASSGLGNEMRGALHALLLAMETQRYLVLDPYSSASIRYLKAARINWSPPSRGYKGNMTFINYWAVPRIERKEMNDVATFQHVYHMYHMVSLNSRSFPRYERMVKSSWMKRFCVGPLAQQPRRCHYDGPHNIAIMKMAHDALFKYQSKETQHAQSIMRLNGLGTGKYAAVHVRVGGTMDPHKGRFQIYNERPHVFARLFASCVLKSSVQQLDKVYVASDDDEFKYLVGEELTKLNLSVVYSPIKAKHTRSTLVWRLWTGESVEDATHGTIVDTLIMGKAKVLITPGSSMSEMAAASGPAMLVQLSHCYRSSPNITSLLNSSWQQL